MLSFPSFLRRRLYGGGSHVGGLLLRLSTAGTGGSRSAGQDQKGGQRHFIFDFLVSELGFSTGGATSASRPLSHLKSLEKPESFVGFMRSQGFSDAHIKKIVSRRPRLLASDVDRTVAPKIQALNAAGFSGTDLIHLVIANCGCILLKQETILSKLSFWQDLLGSRDHLVRLLKTHDLLSPSIQEVLRPNLSFLQGCCGISSERIRMFARNFPRFIVHKRDTLVATADRVEKEIGLARSSGMFLWAMEALSYANEDGYNARLKLMQRFGWSQADFLLALRGSPSFLHTSQELLCSKMEFLLREAGWEPMDVARYPKALNLSLEKTLVPRSNVIKILKSRGLLTKEPNPYALTLSKNNFMSRFVTPHLDKIPELQEILPLHAPIKGAGE